MEIVWDFWEIGEREEMAEAALGVYILAWEFGRGCVALNLAAPKRGERKVGMYVG